MIPRTIHQIWVGGPVPEEFADYRASWQLHHPGWEHRLWTDADFGWLANQDLFDQAEKHTSSVGQFRADIARYEILHRHGGVYVDVDFECRRPLDPLLEDLTCFAAWERDGVWVNNAILGAEPGHPMLAELVTGLRANVRRRRGKRPNVMTGPQYLTPIARRHPDVTIFPSAMFYPYPCDELDRADGEFPLAWAVHHWNNARTRMAGRA